MFPSNLLFLGKNMPSDIPSQPLTGFLTFLKKGNIFKTLETNKVVKAKH